MFIVNKIEFGWEEIIAAAQSWGEWERFMERTRQVLACLRMATETNQLPSAKDVREAVTAFRYAHHLISAEDTQTWLNRWEMTIDDLTTYLRAQLLANRWENQLERIAAESPISDEVIAKVVNKHVICAGLFKRWAQELAGRSAIVSGSLKSGAATPRELVAQIETEFQQARQQAVTPQLLQTKIADHRLDWIRFECRCVWFGDEPLAREALWCVTEDGLSLDEVAADARVEVRDWDFYLDELEAETRPHFLAARKGDLLGPLKFRNGFSLVSLTEKTLPTSDDPQIYRRAEHSIIAGLMSQAINERVKWMI